jgi:pimeloyl-ACP methyl ester carboxylesterase
MSEQATTYTRAATTGAPLGTLANPDAGTDDVESSEIRPFRIDFPKEALDDLRRRINATRFPERETVPDQSQGVQAATIHTLARYWGTQYDWRRCEAMLNGVPNFITEIDGLDIHFIHVRSRHRDALPMIVTHGWPGSIIEQMKIVEPLTNPTREEDAFHLVIPSIPGFGFSGKPTAPGWDPQRIARAWATLMQRLGYTRYVAQGGDWGAVITTQMALQKAPGLVAIHENFCEVVPPGIEGAAATGAPPPAGLSDEELRAYEQMVFVYKHVNYAFIMADRPQTLTALADSPVGLAAFMLDHDQKSYAMIARSIAGQREGLSRDDVLDNITLFWLTNTAISAARIYWENKLPFFTAKGVTIPAAVSVFPDELYQPPRSWAERAFPQLLHYNTLPKGGHFAAWEQPELFTQEMRAAFRAVRQRV